MENTAKKFISWRRVSTKKQGKSGLGLEAQKDIIDYFVKAEKGVLIADYVEVYTGKDLEGCKELQKAMEHCKQIGATLIIAKTDRFRNTIEALQTYDDMNGNIYFCDLPYSDKFTLTLFFSLAEREALMVSIRTKAALKAKAARGETWDRKGRQTIHIASKESAKARIERAKEDKTNVFFKTCMERIESKHGITFGKGCGAQWFELLAEELNAYNVTTSSGLKWDIIRARTVAYKIKKRYGLVW